MKLTKEQQKALFKIYQRDWSGHPEHPWRNYVTRRYRQLRRTVRQGRAGKGGMSDG